MIFIKLIFALGTLFISAQSLVSGSRNIAAKLGLPPLIIGLTIVSFGTSFPELTISIRSVLQGLPAPALGTVVGSNIFNILFILGVCALIRPIVVSSKLVRAEVPIMILVSLALFLMSLDGVISFNEGVCLLSSLVIYVIALIWQGRNTKVEQNPQNRFSWILSIILVVLGLIGLDFGTNWLIGSTVFIAEKWGISQVVIGLTIVAAGTSMPELITSVVALLRKETGIAVGNIVGSNIFNILGILGFSSIISMDGLLVPVSLIAFNIPIMLIVAFVCLFIVMSGSIISRREGFVLLGLYGIYITFLL